MVSGIFGEMKLRWKDISHFDELCGETKIAGGSLGEGIANIPVYVEDKNGNKICNFYVSMFAGCCGVAILNCFAISTKNYTTQPLFKAYIKTCEKFFKYGEYRKSYLLYTLSSVQTNEALWLKELEWEKIDSFLNANSDRTVTIFRKKL